MVQDQEKAQLEKEIANLHAEMDALKRELAGTRQTTALGQLISSMVHEINTPLGSLFANAEALEHFLASLRGLLENLPLESRKKGIEILEVCGGLVAIDRMACERISTLIRSLKMQARPDAEARRAANVNEILRDALQLARANFRNRIQVELDLGELPNLPCYPDQLGQVFLNVLVNAAQAIEGEGTIRLRTQAEEGQVRVSIQDTGRGMSPDEQRLVFQRGFTTRASRGGTGWGLSIAQDIVCGRHGGTIRFESQPGVGTTFHIHLPLPR